MNKIKIHLKSCITLFVSIIFLTYILLDTFLNYILLATFDYFLVQFNYYFLSEIISKIILITLIILLYTCKEKTLHIRLKLSNLKTLGFSILLASLFTLAIDPVINWQQIVNAHEMVNMAQPTYFSLYEFSMKLLLYVILVPVVEELVFRSIILKIHIEKKGRTFSSILLCSFFFALSHINFGSDGLEILSTIIYTFMFSILACLLFLSQKHVLYVIIFHATYNLLVLSIDLYYTKYILVITYLNFNFTYWVIVFSSTVLIIYLAMLLPQRIRTKHSGITEF